ncbi:MAG: Ig-like domain-containing protein [Leptospirales bacterium]|nr:Ig-like domain-containing protein [Leptospirales bacterium]
MRTRRRIVDAAFPAFVASLCLLQCAKAADALDALLPPPGGERPRITLSSPSSASPTVAASSAIFVEFDREMDRESTRSAFSISGDSPPRGQPLWEGRRLYFDLEEDLQPGASYLLRVGGEARSAEGAPLEVEYLVFFSVGMGGNAPRVVSHLPARGAQGVDPAATIELRFSRAMNRTSVEQAFSVSPAAPGAFQWDADDAGFRFTPFAALNNGGLYSVRILSSAAAADGSLLGENYSWSFQSGLDLIRPQLEWVRENGSLVDLLDGVAGIYKDSALVLRFSEPMHFASAESAVTLTRVENGAGVALLRSWSADFRELTIAPQEALEPLQIYRLRTATSARDLAGNDLLLETQLAFQVNNSAGAINSEYLQIVSANKTTPAPLEPFNLAPDTIQLLNAGGCDSAPLQAQLTLDFDHSLNPATVAEALSFARLFGPSGQGATLVGIAVESSGVRPADRLRIYLSDVCDSLYTLRIFGGRNGLRSAAAGPESGTWLREDRTFYLRFNP